MNALKEINNLNMTKVKYNWSFIIFKGSKGSGFSTHCYTPTTTTTTRGCNDVDCHLEYLTQIQEIAHCLLYDRS